MSGLTRHARTLLRERVGIWVLYEARNKILMSRGARHWTRVENREVARLLDEIGGPRRARVATVIPTYRRPDQLRLAVQSALEQTVDDHAIVVVDDGGADLPTLPDDPRLTVVSLSANTHVLGLVRNVGIRLTESAYIAFLDDDNTWYDRHLAVAVAELDKGVGLVYTSVERLRADGSRYDVLSVPFDRRKLSDDSFVDSNSIVLRRSRRALFSRIPRKRGTLPKEDWEFVYRLSRTYSVRHLPTTTVRYLVNDQSHYTSWDPQAAPDPDGASGAAR